MVINNVKAWLGVWLVSALFAAPPSYAYERVVSTTGNASEIIYNLGLVDSLVAVDTTSTLPSDVMKNKPKIGYRRQLSSEGILSMRPDLLILAPDAGPPAVKKQLQASGLNIITIADDKSVDGVISDIEMIANTLGARKAAQPMIDNIRADEKKVKALIANYPHPPKIAFMMDGGIGKNSMTGLGAKSAGGAMIHVVGGKNVFDGEFDSVKPVSLEALMSTDMDMILIAAHGASKPSTPDLTRALERYKNLALTKAGKKQCVFTIGSVESLGFGPGFMTAALSIAEAVNTCTQK